MKNRILEIGSENHFLSPALAEVWLTAFVERVTPTTEVRGRLMGPRCLFATTVEVAYPLRPVHEIAERPNALTVRTVIPEPNLWDPESPFAYRAIVELWQDGEQCNQAGFDYGLRTTQPMTSGVRWNSKVLAIRGTARLPVSQEEVLRLRQAGYNLLLTSLPGQSSWWTKSNRLGFWMLGRLPPAKDAFRLARVMGAQVCSFGWLLEPGLLEADPQIAEFVTLLRAQNHMIGMELDKAPQMPLPKEVGFIACAAPLLPQLTDITLPKIVLGPLPEKDVVPPPGILGWVD